MYLNRCNRHLPQDRGIHRTIRTSAGRYGQQKKVAGRYGHRPDDTGNNKKSAGRYGHRPDDTDLNICRLSGRGHCLECNMKRRCVRLRGWRLRRTFLIPSMPLTMTRFTRRRERRWYSKVFLTRETRDERRETRDERRETKDERRKTRNDRRQKGDGRKYLYESDIDSYHIISTHTHTHTTRTQHSRTAQHTHTHYPRRIAHNTRHTMANSRGIYRCEGPLYSSPRRGTGY